MPSTYNAWLVALSIGVAVLVSFTSLRLAGRVAGASPRAGRTWLTFGAVSMGVGIWSMHFIGMLAFSVSIPLRYDVGPTVASLAIAVLTSGFAIKIASSATLKLARHAVCSLVMGAGIVAMHYIGMSSIPIAPAITYDPLLVAGSIAIAVGASFAALWLAFKLRKGVHSYASAASLGAAVVMGCAIAGMHYTAMAAAKFPQGAVCQGGLTIDNRWLAILVAVATLALLAITLITAVFDAQFESRMLRDSQRLERADARLHYQSTHDSLTDLPNRAAFIERLQEAIEQATTTSTLLAIMVVDLDRFKSINDSLGHGFGDAILREVALRLQAAIGDCGFAARLGGDEFLVLARLEKAKDVARLGEQIVSAVSRIYAAGPLELYLAASVGITTYPFDNATSEVLIAHADEAMYDIKRDGGHGYRFFVPGTTIYTIDRLQLESDLRRAVELGQLEVHYQPVVEVPSGRIAGFEALARWRHPHRGWIAPSEFIPLAEASDVIAQIGGWVLNESCRQARAWVDQGFADISVAVNLSARQFVQPNILASFQESIARHGLRRTQPGHRADRVRHHARGESLDRDSPPAARLGLSDRRRRFRDRVFLHELPEAAPGEQAQDRSHLHQRSRHRRQERFDRPRRDRTRARARHGRRRRGCGDQGVSCRACSHTGATSIRAITAARRAMPRRSPSTCAAIRNHRKRPTSSSG